MTEDLAPSTPDAVRHGDVVVVRMPGEVSLHNVAELKRTFLTHLVDGCRVLVVDLGGVTFMDSVGLAALVSAHRKARVLQARIVLWRPHGTVRRVIEITGLDRVFVIEAEASADPSTF